jgi:hypothetical protein
MASQKILNSNNGTYHVEGDHRAIPTKHFIGGSDQMIPTNTFGSPLFVADTLILSNLKLRELQNTLGFKISKVANYLDKTTLHKLMTRVIKIYNPCSENVLQSTLSKTARNLSIGSLVFIVGSGLLQLRINQINSDAQDYTNSQNTERANLTMDICNIGTKPKQNELNDCGWRIYSKNARSPEQRIAAQVIANCTKTAEVKQSLQYLVNGDKKTNFNNCPF